jgi:hypothetical protein
MHEFNTVIELLAKGDVERAASEFADAVYTRQKYNEVKDEEKEDRDES